MIRFVIKKEESATSQGMVVKTFLYTLDIEVPELENALTKGGYSERAFECHSLVGCEVLQRRGGE